MLQALAWAVLTLVCCRLWSTMGLDLQSDLCSLLIDDVIYHEAAVRHAGAEALSQAVARYQRQAAEVMGRLMEIYQEKLYVSDLGSCCGLGAGKAGGWSSAQLVSWFRDPDHWSLCPWARENATGHSATCLLQRPPPVLDALGRVISESPPDQWEAR